MKQRKVVSMIGALVVIISAVVLITGCSQPNSNKGNTGNNSGNISNTGNTGNNGGNTGNIAGNTGNNGGNTGNNGGNTGNNGGNTGNNGGNEEQQEDPKEANPVIGVWQQLSNRSVYWVFFETGEFCMAKYHPNETLGSHYTRTAIGFYTVKDDYIRIPKGYIHFEKITTGGKTFLNLANGKQTILKVSSPSFDEIRDAPDTMPLP